MATALRSGDRWRPVSPQGSHFCWSSVEGESWSRCSGSSDGSCRFASGMMILTCVQPQCHVTAHSCSVLYARGWTPAGGGSFRPSRVPKNLSRLRASNTATVCRYAHSDRSGLFYFRSESPASPQDAGSSLVAFECQEDARTHYISEALGFVQPHPAGRVLLTWESEFAVVCVDPVRQAGESVKRRQAVFR